MEEHFVIAQQLLLSAEAEVQYIIKAPQVAVHQLLIPQLVNKCHLQELIISGLITVVVGDPKEVRQ